MTISEKVAYLKGLSDGLNIDTEKSKEGKLISVIIDILEEVGMSIEDLEENATAMGEDDDEDDDDCCCCDDDDFFEVECPNCKEELCIDEDVLEAGFIECPNCHEKFALEVNEDECGCGCGCGCEDEDDDE